MVNAAAKLATVGMRGTDSVTLIDTPAKAQALRAAGTDFVLQYLGSVTADVISNILGAGMGFMPVTYADKWDGPVTCVQLHTLGVPAGVTVWLDVEGQSLAGMDPQVLKQKITDWANTVKTNGWMPGMYVGPGCPLTSAELYALPVVRYWHAGAQLIDRNGHYSDPGCGFAMVQLYPSVTWGGVWSDLDFIQEDFHGRLPTLMVSS